MRHALTRLLTINHTNENVRRRGQTAILVALGIITTTLLLFAMVIYFSADRANGIITLGIGDLLFVTSIVLTRRGAVVLGAGVMIATCIVGVLAPIATFQDVNITPFFLVFSIVIGGLVLKPWQIWLVLLAVMLGLLGVVLTLPSAVLARSDSQTALSGSVIILLMVTSISFLAARQLDTSLVATQAARQAAQTAASDLNQANVELEQRVAERTNALRIALTEVEARATEQLRLLAENERQRATIREMSVPVLPVSHGTLVMPLIGALDSTRLQDVQTQALRAIERSSAHHLLIDITGLWLVDTLVAQGLLSLVQAAYLLGADVALIGVRPEVAQTMISLGVDLSNMKTFIDLQTALQ